MGNPARVAAAPSENDLRIDRAGPPVGTAVTRVEP